jgi:selenocysteine-specific elongation factor
MRHINIGTAGHVDHGKTSLVKALTGIDCDRLKEEKERGMTIELGYAYLYLGDGTIANIIDVPGHERFVKTMIAGAGVIDCVLFVIAADDGIMPQTVEHLDIINLLGIKHGLIVLTKVDLVDEDWLLLVEDEIYKLIKGTNLESAPIIKVVSLTRKGIDELKQQIKSIASKIVNRNEKGVFRFPIDWTFNVSGIGPTACGVVFSGKAKVGDKLELVPQQKEVKIKGIQVHGEGVNEVTAGQQVALSISGAEPDDLHRGDVLTVPNYLQPTYMLDASLHLLNNSNIILENRTRIRLHIACSEVFGRVVLLDKESLAPGEDAFVQFRLEEQITAEHGDRYVIRQYSPMRTIGGGMILDACPQKHRQFRPEVISYLTIMANGTPKDRIEQIILRARTQAMTEWEIIKLSNISPDDIRQTIENLISDGKIFVFDKEQYIHIEWYNKTKDAIINVLELFHAEQPLKLGMSREELRTQIPYEIEISAYNQVLQDLINDDKIATDNEGKIIRLFEHKIKLSASHELIKKQIEEIFLNTGTSTPLPEDVLIKWSNKEAKIAKEAFEVLVETGVLIQVDEKVFFHKQTIDKAKEIIIHHIKSHGKLTLNDCRDLFNITRKYMLPLLYHFDKTSVTLRIGDDRILKSNRE